MPPPAPTPREPEPRRQPLLARLRGHHRSRELELLLWALAILVGLWLFVALGGEVAAGDFRGVDERLLLALRDPLDPGRPRGPAWLAHAARDVTALGSTAVLGMVIAAALGFLSIVGKRRMALVVLAAGAGGLALSALLKEAYERPRPTLVPQLTAVQSLSFPSGHAMGTAAVYLSLAVLIARLTQRRLARVYVVAIAGVLTLLVGSTRVYLGVHYPTDVLAGWVAGITWALLCGLAGRRLQRRHAVEAPAPAAPETEAGDRG